ncbi:MAG: TetR/AcrR family transcriptional regulator C-terminal domain-containing protein [Acholeplasmatales bacterium]|nr:TetR/AcrR family transcriptional regulator C-terminal domain-containing protein [Acholeplasmatales bacterium]
MADLRVIKTKQSIKGAFMDLVLEKGFEHVSVKDICNKAMINRNTFYLHYLDKIDLLEKIVKEVFLEQEKDIIKIKEEKTKRDIETIKLSFKRILNAFYEEIEFYRIILLDSNTSGHVDKCASSLLLELAYIYDLDYEKNKIKINYVFYGIVGVIKTWIIKDYDTINNIADTLTKLTVSILIEQ